MSRANTGKRDTASATPTPKTERGQPCPRVINVAQTFLSAVSQAFPACVPSGSSTRLKEDRADKAVRAPSKCKKLINDLKPPIPAPFPQHSAYNPADSKA